MYHLNQRYIPFSFFILYQDARPYQLYLEIIAVSGHDRGYRMSSSLRNSPLGTCVTQKALIIAWHEAMNCVRAERKQYILRRNNKKFTYFCFSSKTRRRNISGLFKQLIQFYHKTRIWIIICFNIYIQYISIILNSADIKYLILY